MSDRIKHSQPISIPNSGVHHHSRARSASYSGSSDDDSNSPPLQTPTSAVPPPRVGTAQSPSTSPILSYFFQAPNKVASVIPQSPTAGFGSIGRGFPAKPQEQPIMEEDEEHESSIVRHARRMSTSAGWAPAAPRFNAPTTAEQVERGAGLLRRLSLGSAFIRPQPPSPPLQHSVPSVAAPAPGSPPTMKQPPSPGRKKRRASTLAVPGEARPRRSPSPMGERILKGHFDGFN
ncbi:uncharacterized protein FOMMEDRAFT_144731 [Fomitiporia mediterranea MF3/22]|uniref:uncharacterized protein n=1 Tax=Fomitiporia mediterranea (strain MF3/22) TaxID=694068 RepID=UPI000440916D|nr:uncharacterized protein FOMMEDRAFT_144731 [Fomitiporia mediterranea MF3/22]EJD06865.1 hypothetical protein FOMMEDRAFT_144731 [Fomitiporia mediterranea MF3/22]